MRPLLTLALACSLVVVPRLAADDDPEPPNPKANAKGKRNGPLLVRLVAKKSVYVLDRQGMTAADYRKAVKDGTVSPPAVDLVLEISNTSKEDVTVRVSGAVPSLTWKLT